MFEHTKKLVKAEIKHIEDSISIAKRTYQEDNPNYNYVMSNIKKEKYTIKVLKTELTLLDKGEELILEKWLKG
jgi:hypothetical protein